MYETSFDVKAVNAENAALSILHTVSIIGELGRPGKQAVKILPKSREIDSLPAKRIRRNLFGCRTWGNQTIGIGEGAQGFLYGGRHEKGGWRERKVFGDFTDNTHFRNIGLIFGSHARGMQFRRA
jgi:hypothetical protein